MPVGEIKKWKVYDKIIYAVTYEEAKWKYRNNYGGVGGGAELDPVFTAHPAYGITQVMVDVLQKMSLENGNVKVDTNLYTTGGLSAFGYAPSEGGGGGWTWDTPVGSGNVVTKVEYNNGHLQVTYGTVQGGAASVSWNDLTTKPTQQQLTDIIGSAYLTQQSLADYATKDWVWQREYVTQSWVENKGYLTSYTESDPVFTAHQAHNITKEMIDVLKHLSLVDGNVKVDTNFYSEKGISAFGYTQSSGGGGGWTWGGISGTGNVVTDIKYENGTLSVTKGSIDVNIGDLATIRSNAGLGATAYGWGNHASAGYFVGTADTIKGIKVNNAVNADNANACSGNAASATKLQTSRRLWGNSFDGSADIDGLITFNNGSSTNDRGIWLAKKGATAASILFGVGCNSGNYGIYEEGKGWVQKFDGTNLTFDYGNVGIGMDNPTAQFVVKSAIDVYGEGEYNGVIGIGRKSATGGSYNANYAGWQIENKRGNLMFLHDLYGYTMSLENKNVGIGTINPQYKLDVAGDIHTSNDAYVSSALYLGNGVNPDFLVFQHKRNGFTTKVHNDSNALWIGIDDGATTKQPLIIWDNAQHQSVQMYGLYAHSNCNVGIGRDTPQYKLDVNGSVRIGNAVLTYNPSNHSLGIQDSSGNPLNLYTTGGLSGYGIAAFESLENLTIDKMLTIGVNGRVMTWKYNGFEHLYIYSDDRVYIGNLTSYFDSDGWLYMPDSMLVMEEGGGFYKRKYMSGSNKQTVILDDDSLTLQNGHSLKVGSPDANHNITDVYADGSYVYITIKGKKYRLSPSQITNA